MTNRRLAIKYPQNLIDTMNEMIQIGNPCFVHGNCGKTELIKILSPNIAIYDSREVLEPKNLGGFYMIVDGELRYSPGVLVQAMLEGHHICFKRIDTNINLFHYLRSVINDRTLTANNGNEIKAHGNFRIFFTCDDVFEVRNVAFIGKIEFRFDDVLAAFGALKANVIEIFNFVNTNKCSKCPRDNGMDCEGICLKELPSCECHLQDVVCSKHFRMLCELRDMLVSSSGDSTNLSNSNRTILYQSFVNIFLKHESKALSEMLYITQAPLVLPNMLFAKTSPVESALRSLILNIKNKRPTLLVGETGAGKTALIQYLSQNSEYFFGSKSRLKILNMSSDFDGSDLVGGYQSIDFDRKIKELYKDAKLEIPKSINKKILLENLLANSNGPVLAETRLLLTILKGKTPFYYKEGLLTEAMRNGMWILMDEINLCSNQTLDLIEAILAKEEMVIYESGDLTPIKIHPDFMVFACMNPHGDVGKKKFDTDVFNVVTFYDFGYKLKCIKSVVQSITRNLIDEVDQISEFYYEFKKAIVNKEYTNIVEPLVSGRTLCRALSLMLQFRKTPNAIYNAFNLLFFTQLDLNSRSQAIAMYKRYFKAAPIQSTSAGIEEINDFIITPKMRMHVADVELAIKANLPILLQGETSTGKTSLILALASKYGRKVVRINNHEHTESSDYLGNYLTTKDGIKFKEGPLVVAMRSGFWVILDELNLAPSDVLEVLNRLFDDNRELYLPETDEVIKPHPNFRIFATQNINYSGRRGLAKSFRNRFIEIFFYEKDECEIKEILERSCKMPSSFIKMMMGVYNTLKVERTINNLITLRDLFKWAKRGPTGYCEVFEIGMNIILERQRSKEDRCKVIEVFTSTFRDRFSIEKRNFLDSYQSANKAYGFMSNGFMFDSITRDLILTRSYIKLIDLIYKAWINYEPVLLIGEAGIGKTRICEAVASLFKISLRSINMPNGTESADFIGHSILDKNEIVWRNGSLVEAMTHGDAFLIDEINLAEDAVLERMNSVLESKRSLFVTETGKDILAHDTFRVVATMNPSGDYGKRELSPALRSRFTEIYFELEQDEYEEIFNKMIDRLRIGAEYSTFFKLQFGLLGEMSIRKIELVCNHIKRLYFHSPNSTEDCSDENDIKKLCIDGSRRCSNYIFTDKINSKEQMWNEVLEILGMKTDSVYDFKETSDIFGVSPYYIKKGNADNIEYAFDTETTRINLQRVIRGLTLNKGILLEGEPGVGKTSIVQSIAKACGVPILRINLSEQTEMSDLIGAYLPIGDHVKFVESEMISFVRRGYWIILDEINLCTQSVIEGLNSILDHRRRIDVDNSVVHVHNNTRIFATMNPCNKSNGRKKLPKSFLDRFIVISMNNYTASDINHILHKRYGEGFVMEANLSLRGNIKYNELQLTFPSSAPTNKFRVCRDMTISEETQASYEFGNGKGRIGRIEFDYQQIPDDYVISHCQLPQIELMIKCLYKGIPIILNGSMGKSSLLKFVSSILGLNLVQINCHRDTDTCDLLGQYQKTDFTGLQETNALFEWKDSNLINSLDGNSLIVFNTPELVEKCVFDRLNALFEGERTINIYEKGIDTCAKVSQNCKFVLCCDSPFCLSPALIDRCIGIDLLDSYSYIDLYKIFNSTRNTTTQTHGTLFRDFIDSNYQVLDINVDLDMKRYKKYSTMPPYLNKKLPIFNSLIESEINQMFETKPREYVEFNKELLDMYKEIRGYSTKLPLNFTERVDALLRRPDLVTFIKCLEFNTAKNCMDSTEMLNNLTLNSYEVDDTKINCQEVPDSLYSYKYRFIESLKHKTLGDVQDILHFSEHITKITEMADVKFDSTIFAAFIASNDPLELIRNEVQNEKAFKENEILRKISETAKSIYKYGIGSLEVLIGEYDDIQQHYSSLLLDIDRRLKRDYHKFVEIIQKISFCDYVNNPAIRIFLEEFNDLSDYFLVHLFNHRHKCSRCISIHKPCTATIKWLSLRLVRTGVYEKCMKYEYSKYLFNSLMGIPQKQHSLVLEAICFNEPVDLVLCVDDLEFTEAEIDECIRNLFPRKTRAQVIEARSTCISIGSDAIPLLGFKITGIDANCEVGSSSLHDGSIKDLTILESIREMNIFSTPEAIINEIQLVIQQNESKIDSPFNSTGNTFAFILRKLNELDLFLKNLYKNDSCLLTDKNYRYFQYFLYNDLDPASLEKLFLGASVYEFLDRIYFSEYYLKLNYSNQLYNAILRYKAFEIENIHSKKLKEAEIKLRKEPKLYESIISEYVDRFMYIPVVNAIKISFDPPNCQKIHEMKGPIWLFDLIPSHMKQDKDSLSPSIGHAHPVSKSASTTLCECFTWIELGNKIDRSTINSSFPKGIEKSSVLHMFYNRIPSNPFSYSEICLAKALNNIMNNSNSSKYDEKTLNVCFNLLSIGYEYVFPPYLYFIYKFSDSFEESDQLEEGMGLRSGEGKNNIDKENIDKEDIVDDYDKNEKADLDDEGIEMDNQGELHSVSGESEGESGVDHEKNDGEKNDEDAEDENGIGEEQVSSTSHAIESEMAENGETESLMDDESNDEDMVDQDSSTDTHATKESSTIGEQSVQHDQDAVDMDSAPLEHSYDWKEAELNHNQTCNTAENYNRKVEGGNFEEKDALKEGEGKEFIEGEDELGKEGPVLKKTVSFDKQPSDCTKLTNLLRIILESNKNNKYKGDFKSGKKLNLKRIVPYIASDYRKDKIWMKRQKSDKKDYVLRIFIDNSKSMFDQRLINILSAVYYKIDSAFSLLNIPVQLYKFGSGLSECKVEDLTFDDDNTFIGWTDDFNDGINIVLTDGIFQTVGYAKDNFLVVMIDKGNVKRMSKVAVLENQVFVEKYLDSFALKYCILQNIEDLEKVFVEALADIIKNLM